MLIVPMALSVGTRLIEDDQRYRTLDSLYESVERTEVLQSTIASPLLLKWTIRLTSSENMTDRKSVV